MTVASVKNGIRQQGQPAQASTSTKLEVVDKFPKLLAMYQDQVARALPAHLKANVDRYTRLALSEFRQNPKLEQCDPLSVFAGVIMASQMGWEIGGVLGQAYLVPYGGEAQLIPGWKGLTDLVHRAGRAAIWTGCVFEGDAFEFQLGDTPYVRHVPKGEDDPEKIVAAYCIGKIRGMEGFPICEVWPLNKLLRHRDRYNKVGRRHYSFENMEMYVRKVVLLQTIKYLPVSAEMSAALALDNAYETGQRQALTIDTVAEGLVYPTGPVTEKHVDQSKPEEKKPEPETKPEAAEAKSHPGEIKTSFDGGDTWTNAEEKPEPPKSAAEVKPDPSKPVADPKVKPTTKDDVDQGAEPGKTKKEKKKSEAPVTAEAPPWATEEMAEGIGYRRETAEPAQTPAVNRIKSPHQSIRQVKLPEYIDRVSEEDAWTPEQYQRLLVQGTRLSLSEEALNKTSVDWLGQPLAVINAETMEALLTVLTSFRPEKK